MDSDTESLLVSTCHALGGFEDRSERMDDASQVYVMGDECLGNHWKQSNFNIAGPSLWTS